MLTSWKVFLRDFSRLVRTPTLWILAIGVMVTPALYSWVNVAAFWDPYKNTQNIGVAVVNEDTGAASDLTGPLNVGEQLVDQLRDNDKLGWRFLSQDEADEAVRRGDVFAAITVPENFSASFISLFEGPYNQPTLRYQVNEKISAIGPKITDKGANTLEQTIGATFNEQVASAATQQLKNSGGKLSDRLQDASTNSADSFGQTADTVAGSRGELDQVSERLAGARPTVAGAKDTLDSVSQTLSDAEKALDNVQSISSDVQGQLTSFSDSALDAYLQGTSALAEGSASANAAVGNVSGELEGALGRVGAATRGAEAATQQADQALEQLQSLASNPGLPPQTAADLRQALSGLQERNASNSQVLQDLGGVQDSASTTLDSLRDASQALKDATAQTQQDSRGLADSASTALPALNSAISRVGATAGRLSGSLASQQTLVEQAKGLLDGVDKQLGQAQGVLTDFSGNLGNIEDSLRTARTDVLGLGRAVAGDSILNTVEGLNTDEVARFMSSPAQMESHAVFPVQHYGSGMSSLFTSLTLWIGAFMLLVIFRTEVDPKGIKNITVAKAYFARFLLLAVFAIGQALIVSIGNLAIGVEHVSALAYVATTVAIGLCYLSIVYALVSTFGHVGRGIAVVFAFIQIPGASGLYPIEMTPDFFRVVHPLLPLTYGIAAMRETVGGFYDGHYVRYMATLIGMAAVAYLAGSFLRRALSSVNLVINDELAKGGLIVDEKVHLVSGRYRINDLLVALQDRSTFEKNNQSRWRSLRENSRIAMLITIAVAALLLLILGAASYFNEEEKAIFFGLACLVTLLAVGIICFIEYINQSLARTGHLAELSEDQLREHLHEQSAHPHAYRLEERDEDAGPPRENQEQTGEMEQSGQGDKA
ncbi:MAG: YhgE/Pip family protein [Corynebacterium flavescens]|uniref:YhgE/Pip domain-containing protein n=1 Tax=Corynebacterium flavescens TaxID=28028 RepID=UPI003F9D24F3